MYVFRGRLYGRKQNENDTNNVKTNGNNKNERRSIEMND